MVRTRGLAWKARSFWPGPGAPPGAENYPAETVPVSEVAALLCRAALSLVHGDRDLFNSVAVSDGADEQLRALVLGLDEVQAGGHLATHGPQAVGWVRDPHASQDTDDAAEHHDAPSSYGVSRMGLAQATGPGDEVGLIGNEQLYKARQLGGVELPVGIGRRYVGCPPLAGEAVTELESVPLTCVLSQGSHERPGSGSLGGCLVCRPVVDYQDIDVETAQLGWDSLHDDPNRTGFVEGRDHHHYRGTMARVLGKERPRRLFRDRGVCPNSSGCGGVHEGPIVQHGGPGAQLPVHRADRL